MSLHPNVRIEPLIQDMMPAGAPADALPAPGVVRIVVDDGEGLTPGREVALVMYRQVGGVRTVTGRVL